MAANKVVFGNKVLIDLTGDTVTEEALLKGYTAHKADGTIITGTAFAGYPNEFVFLDNIEDSSGNPIKDSSGKTIQGQTIYRKARNSVLLDSTGDVIEDGFEQQIEVVKFVWVSFISRLFLHLNPLGTVNAGQFVSIVEILNAAPTLPEIDYPDTTFSTGVENYFSEPEMYKLLYDFVTEGKNIVGIGDVPINQREEEKATIEEAVVEAYNSAMKNKESY